MLLFKIENIVTHVLYVNSLAVKKENYSIEMAIWEISPNDGTYIELCTLESSLM
jgi:hypothetical protein